jgi:hypothetical protein
MDFLPFSKKFQNSFAPEVMGKPNYNEEQGKISGKTRKLQFLIYQEKLWKLIFLLGADKGGGVMKLVFLK